MPANAAIYLPTDSPDLTKIFPGAKSDIGLFKRRASQFTVPLNGSQAVFNVMPDNDLQAHLDSFLRYIDSLDEDAQRKADASQMVRHTKCVLGLLAAQEFEDNHAIWQSLFRIADAFDGYVFVHNSLLLPSGGVIFGPLRNDT